MASGVLKELRARYSKATITALGKDSICTLFTKDPHLDILISMDERLKGGPLIQELKSKQFDLAVLLTHSFSSAWIFYRAGIKTRIGYSKDLRGWMLSNKLPYPKEKDTEHHTQTYLRLVRSKESPKAYLPKLYLSDQEKKAAAAFLDKCEVFNDHLLIGINPVAAFGPSKCWPPEYYRKLAIELIKHPNLILFFFGDEKGEITINQITHELGPRVFNLAGGTTLRQLMALIHRCDLFLTNDSGPMHMAYALDVSVIALFGSTSPKATGPLNQSKVIYRNEECSPCYKRECPIDFRCMRSIHVEEVYQQVKEHLKLEVSA